MDIKQLSFSYDKKKDQLMGINCQFQHGKITTIIGPNGCGKSTLLGVMSQNYMPHSGEVILDGKAIASYKPRELAQRLAVVHQQNEAPLDLTVEKLTSFGRMAYKGLFSGHGEEDEKAVDWALSCTNLLEKRGVTLDQLSGGEKQRVWIAMALAQQTQILFLDEPTTFLDIYYQIEVLELVKSLNVSHGLTIIMVLHDINQAIRYSDEIVVMKHGRVELQGAPQEIITAQTIQSVYGVQSIIRQDEEAGMIVLPVGI
ncbi:ABC transporter ATP-binding protein [Paenibacillus validus]|uniref:ATP-binding cassette domain-containing protein n=1 Tax=Paenibacillus validus TaxID=44253 RepID=A0A7X2Z7S3_9BACL|nr:ABC transporter ATP-binding protein [Paenibacillus validus]MUG69181.1 ATP-binding cassette domain-containing protein [Paenibacillus validus]